MPRYVVKETGNAEYPAGVWDALRGQWKGPWCATQATARVHCANHNAADVREQQTDAAAVRKRRKTKGEG